MKRLLEQFMKNTGQKEFRVEKVIKRKGDKRYVKMKGYANSFNSWINVKDIVQGWVNIFLYHIKVLVGLWKLN